MKKVLIIKIIGHKISHKKVPVSMACSIAPFRDTSFRKFRSCIFGTWHRRSRACNSKTTGSTSKMHITKMIGREISLKKVHMKFHRRGDNNGDSNVRNTKFYYLRLLCFLIFGEPPSTGVFGVFFPSSSDFWCDRLFDLARKLGSLNDENMSTLYHTIAKKRPLSKMRRACDILPRKKITSLKWTLYRWENALLASSHVNDAARRVNNSASRRRERLHSLMSFTEASAPRLVTCLMPSAVETGQAAEKVKVRKEKRTSRQISPPSSTRACPKPP